MPEQPGSGRIDAETLAAYLDGQLPPEARAKVEAEIAADPETYEWLVNALGVADDVEEVGRGSAAGSSGGPSTDSSPVVTRAALAPPPQPAQRAGGEAAVVRPPVVLPFSRRRPVRAAIGAMLATAAALVLVARLQPAWWQQITGPATDPRFEKLVAAAGEERYIEGRLTGGFKHGPLRSATRGLGDLSNQNLALLAAAGELEKAAQAEPSAENLHAWGVAQVLLGEWDGAVATLQSSVTARSTSEALGDLAAVYVSRYALSGRTEDLELALRTADDAIRADPHVIEPYFTRALALEYLDRPEEAAAAWQRYLALDPVSEWSAEARDRLGMLSR